MPNFGAIVYSNHPFILAILQQVQDGRKGAANPFKNERKGAANPSRMCERGGQPVQDERKGAANQFGMVERGGQPVRDERKGAANQFGMEGIKGMGYFGNSLKNRFDNSEIG